MKPRFFVRIGLAALLVAGAGAFLAPPPPARAAGLAGVATFGLLGPGSRVLGPANPHTLLHLTFVLRASAPGPGRVLSLHPLTPAQLAARYSPSPTRYRALVRYLVGQGFTRVRTWPNRLVIDAAAPLGVAERALHTREVRALLPGFGVGYAPSLPVRLPQRLAATAAAVYGLTDRPLVVPAPLVRSWQGPVLPRSPAPQAGPAPTVGPQTAQATPWPGLTVSGPPAGPTGQEVDFTVHLTGPSGAPLAGYTVAPAVPPGVKAYYGDTGPNSLVTNAQGEAFFWLVSPNPASFTVDVTATAPGAPAGAPPVYLSAQGASLTVAGPPVLFQPLTAAQINRAYDATPLLDQGANGHGVGIGIVIWNSFSLSDISQFFASEGIPEPKVTVVPVDGTPVPGDGGVEATLDVERSGSAAPGASITVYDAATTAGVIDALETAISADQVNVLSLSWGIPEDDLPDQYFAPLEGLFDYAAAEGITVFVSSGDTGSNADPTFTAPNINWPSDGPAVVSVGGTEIAIDAGTGQIASEEAWSPDGTFTLGANLSAPSSSTGGFSRYFPRPLWQVAPGLPDPSQEPFRGVPDVSLAATYPGYATFVGGKLQGYGGTSASSPTWAGYLADIESGLGGGRFGASFAPLLYAIYDSPAGPQVFHPITAGENGLYRATPGWNPVTGLGTPDVAQLAAQVDQALLPTGLVVSPGYGVATLGHTLTVGVWVVDRLGIPLAGSPVTASVNSTGAEVSPASTTTGLYGEASFRLTGRVPGQVTVTFTSPTGAGQPPLVAHLTVDWVAATPPPSSAANPRP